MPQVHPTLKSPLVHVEQVVHGTSRVWTMSGLFPPAALIPATPFALAIWHLTSPQLTHRRRLRAHCRAHASGFDSPCQGWQSWTAITSTVPLGESIASEGNVENMYVEGRGLTPSVEPIPGAVMGTLETACKGVPHSISSIYSRLMAIPPPTRGYYDTQILRTRPPRITPKTDKQAISQPNEATHTPRAMSSLTKMTLTKKSLVGEYVPSAGRGRLRPCCRARPHSVSTTLCFPSPCLGKRGFRNGIGFKLLTYDIVPLTEDKDECQ